MKIGEVAQVRHTAVKRQRKLGQETSHRIASPAVTIHPTKVDSTLFEFWGDGRPDRRLPSFIHSFIHFTTLFLNE